MHFRRIFNTRSLLTCGSIRRAGNYSDLTGWAIADSARIIAAHSEANAILQDSNRSDDAAVDHWTQFSGRMPQTHRAEICRFDHDRLRLHVSRQTRDGPRDRHGTFDSAYTMTVTSQSEAAPGSAITMRMEAKWLGPCAADQKPGDMIFANGVKVNILHASLRVDF
jgi:hypothetical protein